MLHDRLERWRSFHLFLIYFLNRITKQITTKKPKQKQTKIPQNENILCKQKNPKQNFE